MPVVEQAEVKPKVDPREKKLRAMLEKPLVDGQNYVGILIEICQLKGWDLPNFEFEERDDGVYRQCFDDGGIGDAISGKKKLAKQRAALNLLKVMPDNHDTSLDCPDLRSVWSTH